MAGLEINKELEVKSRAESSKSLQKLFFSDLNKFIAEMTDKQKDYQYISIFQAFYPNKVYRYLLRLDNPSSVKIIRVLAERKRQVYNGDLKLELDFFQSLSLKVKKKAQRLNHKNVSGFIWDDLDAEIKAYIEALS